jgi:predicted small metal-binding protein
MREMPLELVCHACDLTIQADSEEAVIDLGVEHVRSVHGRVPAREQIRAKIRHRDL